jgi:hypothetical protein
MARPKKTTAKKTTRKATTRAKKPRTSAKRFGADIEYYTDFRSITDLVAQIREQLWNITIQSADIAYTDALEFYSSVREAAKRRVDAAETLYHALSPFFKHHRGEMENGEAAPTKKQEFRNAKGLIDGNQIIAPRLAA